MQRKREFLYAAAIGTLAALFALLLQWNQWLEGFELRATDLMMRLRGQVPSDPRVLVCDIDAASVDRYGQWPWPRTVLAKLVDRLSAGGARVIAFDVVFAEPSRGGAAEDQALTDAISKAGNVVLGYYFRNAAVRHEGGAPQQGGDPGNIIDASVEQVIDPAGGLTIPARQAVEPNIDLLASAANSQGFFSIDPDADGVVRHYAVVAKFEDIYYPALAVRAVQRALDQGPLALAPYQGALPELTLGGRGVPINETGQLWINYRGPARSFATVSAQDVIEGRVDPAVLKDRIVFIGASEIGIADLRATPMASVVPGVEVHATVADNLLNDRYIHDTALHLSISIAALLILGPGVGLLVLALPHTRSGFLMSSLPVFGWALVSWVAFSRFNVHLQLVAPFLSASLAYLGVTVYETVFVEAKARQIRKTFQQFVSASIVEEMLKDPDRVKLGGERRDMTVLFSDIRGFTTISEKLDPDQVAKLLNAFLTPMTRIVLDCGGTLDKYMGDAIMAFFGAPTVQPDHAARACRATLQMRDELKRLNALWKETGVLPSGASQLEIGIGLNSGEMSVGNMGSEAVFDYTVIGDNVNLGSRLEGLNKMYGTAIIVSEATLERAGKEFVFRDLDCVRVKGKKLPVNMYELIGEAPCDPTLQSQLDTFNAAVAAYRNREFTRAESMFAELAGLPGHAGPAELYLERCRALIADPPPVDWEAVENLTSK